MKSTKRIAVIVGLLFLGVILEIICGVAVVGIGVLMFPILKLFNKRLAFGYVIFRIIECTIIIVGGIHWFGPLLIGLFYRRLNIHKSFALNLS